MAKKKRMIQIVTAQPEDCVVEEAIVEEAVVEEVTPQEAKIQD